MESGCGGRGRSLGCSSGDSVVSCFSLTEISNKWEGASEQVFRGEQGDEFALGVPGEMSLQSPPPGAWRAGGSSRLETMVCRSFVEAQEVDKMP